ncbi:hypothetical protein EF903_01660 [Streptomyces sp. WAC05292]|uniref:hypothetical protein n=1 Tax=Streptomyces sp. WAC05292 TaxID=2487418 RepID=UPI000F745010|nr:hypothetical protein [Streptomyces sp. WAC05292]RSS97253.1 hypothetical protein EF903_01660 [Streptomyces sp. WAC05292]
MAKFHVEPGLEEKLAALIAPKIYEIAREVERQAKVFAPPTKKWVTVADDKVRPTHIAAHGQEVPANLRFKINSMQWDRDHRGVGPLTYMKAPRDESSRAVANLKNCRCHARTIPDGISRHINTRPPVVTGSTVTVKVVAVGEWVIPAEIGTVYPGNLEAKGAYYMARAAAAVAARH